MMLSNHDVICILVNIALLRQKILVSSCIFYSILDIRFHIDASSNEESISERFELLDRTFYKSILRHISSQYVYRISIHSFCSLRIDAWRNLKIYDVERACSKALDTRMRIVEKASELIALKKLQNSSLKKLKSTSLRELARKLQTELVKILSRRHKRLLWRSVENTVFADAAVRVQLYESINWV